MFQYLPMASCVMLLGGECTGKSALAQALVKVQRASSRTALLVPEVLREFVDRVNRTPTVDEQRRIMESQQRAVESALQQGVDLVVSDPAPLMTAVYSIQYFNDHTLLPSAIHDITNADLVVWCAPDVPWQPDGKHRDGPQARDLTDQLIRSQIEPALTGTRLIRVSGSPANRLDKVLTALGSSTP